MKRLSIVLFALTLILVMTGCQSGLSGQNATATKETETQASSAETTAPEATATIGTTESTTATTAKETPATEATEATTAKATPATEATTASLLPAIPDEFQFMSGVGGWSTTLHIKPDGTFEGYFYDSDMGDTGDNYPNGTRYECVFSGKFTDIQKVSDYEYTMRLESITCEGEIDSERIEDGVRIITSNPYGMDNADIFELYLPGRVTADLPEAFIQWVASPNVWSMDDIPDELPLYGLYNIGGEEGFFAE